MGENEVQEVEVGLVRVRAGRGVRNEGRRSAGAVVDILRWVGDARCVLNIKIGLKTKKNVNSGDKKVAKEIMSDLSAWRALSVQTSINEDDIKAGSSGVCPIFGEERLCARGDKPT